MSDLNQVFSEIYYDSGDQPYENAGVRRRITAAVTDRAGYLAKFQIEITSDPANRNLGGATLSHWSSNVWQPIVKRYGSELVFPLETRSWIYRPYPTDDIIESMVAEACTLLDMS